MFLADDPSTGPAVALFQVAYTDIFILTSLACSQTLLMSLHEL